MNKERRLGRGLEALLGRPLVTASEAADGGLSPADAPRDGLLQVHVYEIENNPFQPRRDFDEATIDELAQSLNEHGMLNPLVVRRQGDRYQLIAGERRLRAAIKAGWQRVPAQVREADDRQMCEIAIVENLQRKDLNPLEKAISFQRYLEQYGGTQEELAGRLKIDRSTVANLIRLLELPETIQQSLSAGELSQGHARALLPLGDERQQVEFAKRIRTESLSVRAIEELVQETIHRDDHEPLAVIGVGPRDKKPRRAIPHAASLELELRTALGTKVDLKSKAGGKGQIVIHFASAEEFDRLRGHLCGRARGSKAG